MFIAFEIKLPTLKLNTQPKQLLGTIPLDITLHGSVWHPVKYLPGYNDLAYYA